MEALTITLVVFLAVTLISACCYFLSFMIHKALLKKAPAGAAWVRFASYVLFFSFIVFVLMQQSLFSMDYKFYLAFLCVVMITAGGALLVSGRLYNTLQGKGHSSPALWRSVSFVLCFSFLLTTIIMIFLANLKIER